MRTTERPVRLAAALLVALALGACLDVQAAMGGDGPAPDAFRGSAVSLDALGRAVLLAASRGDVTALDRFRLTQSEHNEVVWPELPASAPEVGFPVDMAWKNIESRNRSALSRILPLYGERASTFEGVRCRGATERFETFVVLTDCWVTFTVENSSQVLEAQLFKDVLVRGGGFKVFRYYDQEPRPRSSSDAA